MQLSPVEEERRSTLATLNRQAAEEKNRVESLEKNMQEAEKRLETDAAALSALQKTFNALVRFFVSFSLKKS